MPIPLILLSLLFLSVSSPTLSAAALPGFPESIAQIVQSRCAPCHQPGQAGPFSLLAPSDFIRRKDQVLEVISKGLMPPWLPSDRNPPFADDRRLTPIEKAVLTDWLSHGAQSLHTPDSASPSKHTNAPSNSWTLGTPDLVVSLPVEYFLPAEGKDVYRNFVIPIPTQKPEFVRALEFKPGNARVVHHAFIFVDSTRQSRRRTAGPGDPSFPGMSLPSTAVMPEGQFLSYQPGKTPHASAPGLSWTLDKDSDLVLQVHLNPSGKPERVNPSVGFFFTDQPPTNAPFKVVLTSLNIDIPAGESNYLLQDQFVVPAEALIRAILPHAHYSARELWAEIVLPDGQTNCLLDIPSWDFRWQGEYVYAKPVTVPKGSTLRMKFRYDNSTNNVSNLSTPPKRVRYGPQSSDEMGELWFQLQAKHPQDRRLLAQAYALKSQTVFRDWSERELALNPTNSEARLTLAMLLTDQREFPAALSHLQLVAKAEPSHAEARYVMGIIYLQQSRLIQARTAFTEAARLNPSDHRALGNLGVVHLRLGNTALAAAQFRKALKLNPDDSLAQENLTLIEESFRNPPPTPTIPPKTTE